MNQSAINEYAINLFPESVVPPPPWQETIPSTITVKRDGLGNIVPGGIGKNWFVAEEID